MLRRPASTRGHIVKSHLTGRKARARRSLAMLAAVAAALLIAASAVAGTHRSGKGSSQADRLRAIEQRRTQALVDADTATARRFMADDYQGINPAGAPLSREELLASVKAGVLDFLVEEPASPITVRLHGDAAVLRYQRSFDLVIAGTRLTHKAWSTELYERRHGRWQIVWEQTTAVPNKPDLFLESLKPTG
jgi:Domain of unknown function (DUF4440)